MSRRKQTNPQPMKRSSKMSDGSIVDFGEDEDQLEDNTEQKLLSSENKNQIKHKSVKKKKRAFSASSTSSSVASLMSCSSNSSNSEIFCDSLVVEENEQQDSRLNIKCKLNSIKTDSDSCNNYENTNKQNEQDTMRVLFSRLQSADCEPADMQNVCNKKKKKLKTEIHLIKTNKNNVIEDTIEQNNDNLTAGILNEEEEDNENNKNNVNNNSSCKLIINHVNNINSKINDLKNLDEINLDNDQIEEKEQLDQNLIEMQCEDDLLDDKHEKDEEVKEFIEINTDEDKLKKVNKVQIKQRINTQTSLDNFIKTNHDFLNKKRKINKTKESDNLICSKSAAEILAKYQSQFEQLSQQLFLSSSTPNTSDQLNELSQSPNLLNNFITSSNTTSSSPLSKPVVSNLVALSNINTSSSLDKLTSIVDSIDKISVNQTCSKSNNSNIASQGNFSTPSLSDSDNGSSNLILQLPTLSNLNKSSKTSPNLYANLNNSQQSQFTLNEMFNMKLLPQHLLELQQPHGQQITSLQSNNSLKSPSTSSTHSSHSSSSSPSFFAKLASNISSNTSNSNVITNLANQLGNSLNQLSSNNNKISPLSSNNSQKSSNSKQKYSTLSSNSSFNQAFKNQSSQLNNFNNNILRQHAALHLLQQQTQLNRYQTENNFTNDLLDLVDNEDFDNNKDNEDNTFNFKVSLLKELKKRKLNNKNEDLISGSGTPLDLSCKREVGNSFINEKLLDNNLNVFLNNSLSSFSSLTNTTNLNNANLTQLNMLINNGLLNSSLLTNNNSKSSFNCLDLLSGTLNSLLNNQSNKNNDSANAISSQNLLGLNIPTNQIQTNSKPNKTKESKTSNVLNNTFNKNNSSSGQQLINSSSNLPSSSTYSNSNISNNNNNSFWNGTKLKAYSASNSVHMPNPKSMQLRERSSNGQGRANPWQTQWMNRSSEQNRDVFTCVWCKLSFPNLDEMTQHMKVSPRCGMAGMQQAQAVSANNPSSSTSSSSSSSSSSSLNTSNTNSNLFSTSTNVQTSLSTTSTKIKQASLSSSNTVSNSSNNQLLSKEKDKSGNQIPRKLVRGQDVWLGRGAEQTRQILKCMWCGQSFKTLDEMSKHMRVTQHYTNIISQEQITSWKQPDEKSQSQMNQVLTCKICEESFSSLKELTTHMMKNSHFRDITSLPNINNKTNINELLKKNTSSSSLNEKESQSPLSTTSSNSINAHESTPQPSNDQKQIITTSEHINLLTNEQSIKKRTNTLTKERRKKSLPVRKLLELERNVPVNNNYLNGTNNNICLSPNSTNLNQLNSISNLSKTFVDSMNRFLGTDKLRNGCNLDTMSTHSNESNNSVNTVNSGNVLSDLITCDECNEKMAPNQFILHLKNCKLKLSGEQNAQLLSLIVAAAQQQQQQQQPQQQKQQQPNVSNLKTSINDFSETDVFNDQELNGSLSNVNLDSQASSLRQETPERADSRQSSISCNSNRTTPNTTLGTSKSNIKNEDKNNPGSVLNALEQLIEKSFDSKTKRNTSSQGILQRLGIDEEVCPPWQTLNNNTVSPSSSSPAATNTNTFYSWSP